MKYRDRLEKFISDLPEAERSDILAADEAAELRISEAYARAKPLQKRIDQNLAEPALDLVNAVSDLCGEGYSRAANLLFNRLIDAFWDREASMGSFVDHVRQIKRLVSSKPVKTRVRHEKSTLGDELHMNFFETLATESYKRFAHHGTERDRVTSREARLQEFVKSRRCTPASVMKAANVDKSTFSRWRRKKPGDRRYIKSSSVASERIEKVLSGDTCLE